MVRIASFNVENLFARPKAFNTADWSLGEPILDAYRKVNALFAPRGTRNQLCATSVALDSHLHLSENPTRLTYGEQNDHFQ
jgi:hypothetical protein